jgi:hypothetical protein
LAIFRKPEGIPQRYNTIDEPDLSATQERVDAYINTTAEKTAIENFSEEGNQA